MESSGIEQSKRKFGEDCLWGSCQAVGKFLRQKGNFKTLELDIEEKPRNSHEFLQNGWLKLHIPRLNNNSILGWKAVEVSVVIFVNHSVGKENLNSNIPHKTVSSLHR
jgi:hypothetical protein